MMTTDLRNLNVEKLKRNPNMKPRRNPIHMDFVDDSSQVFKKFNFKDSDKLFNGGHNNIYINDDFTLRITRLTFQPENEKFDNDVHMNTNQKMNDEIVLKKALKHKMSPRVYLFSNIMINNKIHRYCVMESYNTCLSKFLKRRQYVNVLEKPECVYKNKDEIFTDIASQVKNLCEKIIEIGIVYYDFKPDNIVVNIDDNTGKISLNMIDWDSEFCVEEEYLKDNEDAVLFLNMCICGYYMYIYIGVNVLMYEINRMMTPNLIDKCANLLFQYDTEYITIILHYFYKSFGMKLNEKDNFDENDTAHREFLKKKVIDQMMRCAYRLDYT